MDFSNIILPGDKIDIRLIHQMNVEENGGQKANVYQSNVSEFISDQEMEILMPMQGGRMVLLQTGAECQFVFYTRSGMYKCRGIVHGRYRKESLYLLDVRIETELTKFQRREFFRIDYVTKLAYYHLEENQAKLLNFYLHKFFAKENWYKIYHYPLNLYLNFYYN